MLSIWEDLSRIAWIGEMFITPNTPFEMIVVTEDAYTPSVTSIVENAYKSSGPRLW